MNVSNTGTFIGNKYYKTARSAYDRTGKPAE